MIKFLFAIIPVCFLIFIGRSKNEGLTIQGDQSTGGQLYTKYCLTCHQADGKGVRGIFPPLTGNARVTGSPMDIMRIVVFGLEGQITVNERDYNQVMPPQGYLTDKQIADILSYVRSSWENKASPITDEDVSKARKLGKLQTQN
jgi:nitrite reductase (NO-forming)